MKRVLFTALTIIGLAVGTLGLQPSARVAAQATNAKNEICQGIGAASGSAGCAASGPSLNTVVSAVINIFSIVVGIAAVIMIMVGGFKYITSAGDSSKISSAKSTIVYAVIGLIVVAFAQFFVQFVLGKLSPAPKKAYLNQLVIENSLRSVI